MGRWVDAAATVICIAAGVYLLSIQTVAENSVFESISHGIGIYFIGKGLFVGRNTHLAAEAADRLKELVQLLRRPN